MVSAGISQKDQRFLITELSVRKAVFQDNVLLKSFKAFFCG